MKRDQFRMHEINPKLNAAIEEVVTLLEIRGGKKFYHYTTHEVEAAMAVYQTAIMLCSAREQGQNDRALVAASEPLDHQNCCDVEDCEHRHTDE